MTKSYVTCQEATAPALPWNETVDVGTRTNRLLVLTYRLLTSNTLDSFSVTYNDVSITESLHFNPSGNYHFYIFHYKDCQGSGSTTPVRTVNDWMIRLDGNYCQTWTEEDLKKLE